MLPRDEAYLQRCCEVRRVGVSIVAALGGSPPFVSIALRLLNAAAHTGRLILQSTLIGLHPSETVAQKQTLKLAIMSTASLDVTGAPDESLLTDNAVKSRLAAFVEPLRAALSRTSVATTATEEGQATAENSATKPIPTINGDLTPSDLTHLTYHLQLFQEQKLGLKAPTRPINPAATEPSHRHPLRIPSRFFLTSPSHQDHAGAITTDAPLYAVLEASLLYLQQHDRKGWADIHDDSQRVFYAELVAHIRDRLAEKGILKPVKVAAPKDWTQAQTEHAKSLARQLGCELQPMLMCPEQIADRGDSLPSHMGRGSSLGDSFAPRH